MTPLQPDLGALLPYLGCPLAERPFLLLVARASSPSAGPRLTAQAIAAIGVKVKTVAWQGARPLRPNQAVWCVGDGVRRFSVLDLQRPAGSQR